MNKKISHSDFISTGLVAQNRRAHFDYQIEDVFIAGLELLGTEVKSLRMGHANINDAYGIEKNGELYMSNMFIAEYANNAFLCDAYDEEELEGGDSRTVLRFHPALAPFKAAVLPLSKKLSEEAHGVWAELRQHGCRPAHRYPPCSQEILRA